MDSFWVFLAGSVTTLAGTFLTHFLAMRKEERMWERQQISEKEKLAREEQKLEKAELIKIYNDAIRYLTMYLNEGVDYLEESYLEEASITAITDEERSTHYIESEKKRQFIYVEMQRSIWLLSLKLNDADRAELDKARQAKNYSDEYIELIMKFARNDKRLIDAPVSTLLLPQTKDILKLTE